MADINLDVDYTDVKQAIEAIKGLGNQAKKTSNEFDTAFNKNLTAVKRMMASTNALNKQQMRQAREEQKALAETVKAQQKAANELDRLKSKYQPMYAAQKAYNNVIKEADAALEAHIITQKEYDAIIKKATTDLKLYEKGKAGWSNQFVQASSSAGKSTNRFGMYAQQVGYQVGDFFVQVQGGTNALVAFGQQGTQLAGLLPGVAGAIVGIGLSITTAALNASGATKNMSYDFKKLWTDVKDAMAPMEPLFKGVGTGIKYLGNRIAEEINKIINFFIGLGHVVKALPEAFRTGFDNASRYVSAFVLDTRAKIYELLSIWQTLMDTISGSVTMVSIGGGETTSLSEDYQFRASALQSQADQLRLAASETKGALSEIADAWNNAPKIDIRDYFGTGGSKDGAGGGGGTSALDDLISDLDGVRGALETEYEQIVNTHTEQLAILNEAYQKRLIGQNEYQELSLRSREQYNEAMWNLQNQERKVSFDAYAGFFGSMATLFEQGNKKQFEMSKKFAIAQSLINSYTAFTEVLKDPSFLGRPWARAAAAGSVLASGLAQVASIKSTSLGSSGSSSSSSGTSAAASAVSASSATSSTTSESKAPQMIQLSGLTANSLFSGSQLQELFDAIYEENKDRGYVLSIG